METHPRLVIFGLALAIRLANIAVLPQDAAAMLMGDAAMYWQGALDSLAAGDFVVGSGDRAQPELERMPFYYAWLMAFQFFFGPVFLPVLIGQALLDSVTCLIVAATARWIDPRLFLPTGLLAAAWPNLWLHSGQLLTDTMFLFFFAASLYGLISAWMTGRWQDALLAGFALGCATMTRPVSYFLIPAAALGLTLMLMTAGHGWRRAALAFVLVLGSSLMVLSPILVRNVTQFGTWSLTSQSGAHLNLWVTATVRSMAEAMPRSEALRIADRHADALALAEGYADINAAAPFVRSGIHTRAALAQLRELPASALVRAWGQGAAINLGAPALLIDARVQNLPHVSFMEGTQGGLLGRARAFMAGSSRAYVAALILGIGFALPAALFQAIGCALHLRAQPLVAAAALSILVYFLVISGPIASPKYRLPMEPVLLIWTALALATIWRHVRGQGKSI